MDENKIHKKDSVSSVTTVLNLILTSLTILSIVFNYVNRNEDIKEIINYDAERTSYRFIFNEKTFDEYDANFRNIDVYKKEGYALYNDSQIPVIIKSIDLYEEIDGERILIIKSVEHDLKLEPGDFKILLGSWKYEDSINDADMFESLSNNVQKKEYKNTFFQLGENSCDYFNTSLDEILLEDYGRYLKKNTYPKRVYKVTTTKDTVIWIKLVYPDDYDKLDD